MVDSIMRLSGWLGTLAGWRAGHKHNCGRVPNLTMVRIQLLHAGEEALFVLVPVALLFFLEYRSRRRDKARPASPAAPEGRRPE
jgi:hypothetical protein